ncbi:MAG: 30S ribosome-binding factor RbfA [Oscillospiraceae bacterium]|nr:30S ribosome-binding factor RbfA [Oscillospiraceae bacterium]
MPGDSRLAKINEEIMRELSVLIPRLKDPRVGGIVSVTRVDTTRDMRCARVYISALPDFAAETDSGGRRKGVLAGLSSASGFLRRELGEALSLRMIPELQFIADDSIERGARVLDVLSSLRDKDQTE